PLREYPVPGGSHPHDVAPAPDGTVWFTAQTAGALGRLDPATGKIREIKLGEGSAPHGVIVGPDGAAWVTDGGLNAVVRVSPTSDEVRRFPLPAGRAGANPNTGVVDRQGRVWADHRGRIWVSEWNAGNVALYDPASGRWREWRVPGERPKPYAVYVDDQDMVWLSDWGANALVRFDPLRETFAVFAFPTTGAEVRQILGRPGEVWGAESGVDKLVVWKRR